MAKKYEITVVKYGFTTITAESEEKAIQIAKEMATDDYDWSTDFEVAVCNEEE